MNESEEIPLRPEVEKRCKPPSPAQLVLVVAIAVFVVAAAAKTIQHFAAVPSESIPPAPPHFAWEVTSPPTPDPLAISSLTTPSTQQVTLNDFDPADQFGTVNFSVAHAMLVLTGMQPREYPLTICNRGPGSVMFKEDDPNSALADRFWLDGKDMILKEHECTRLRYHPSAGILPPWRRVRSWQ